MDRCTDDNSTKSILNRSTEELAKLRGQGIWWGPGWLPDQRTGYGITECEQFIHFKPR